MGLLLKLQNAFKPPSMQEIISTPNKIKEESVKNKANTIDVFFIDSDFKACDQVTGTITRKTKTSIVNVKVPENLAFWKVQGATVFNRTTGRSFMLAVEDYPYGLQLDRELIDEERNMTASEEISAGIKLPVLLDKLPYYVEKTKIEDKLRELLEDNYFELTPSMLYDLGNVNLTDGVTEEDKSVVPVTLGIGILIGMVFMALISAFASGG